MGFGVCLSGYRWMYGWVWKGVRCAWMGRCVGASVCERVCGDKSMCRGVRV